MAAPVGACVDAGSDAAENRLTSFKDDAGNTSTWAYDAEDRPTTMTYPGGSQQVAYVYDANDNVTQTTDPAGNVVSDTFDVLNRRTGRSVSLASGFLGTTSESYGYDALNRMTSAEDNDYKVEFTHAVIGLRSMPYEETQRYTSGSAYSKTVTKGYDARGLLTSEAYPSGASLTLTRAYNDLGAQSSVTDGTNTIASWTYVGFRPKVVTFGNTTTQTNTWTGFRDEVSTVNHKNSGGTTLLRLDYGYDKVHTRTYERYGAPGYAGDGFAYDKAQRLTTAWMGSSTPANPSGAAYVTKLDFNMDDDGNRTSVVTTPYQQSPTTVSYTTNALNQYTAVGGASWTHDANGNVTNNGTWKFEYDYRNQIVRVKDASNNAVVATYRYDALGRRVEKDVSGGVFERYVYSGLETVAVYGPSDAWKQNFVFGQGIDDVLMLEQADVLDQDSDSDTSERTRSYYHKNALGSVMEITTASQTEAASYRYTPYGEVTITKGGSVQSSDPLGQHWGYTARFHDAETGLTYFRARYQDPVTGRFLQRDPVGYSAGASLYEYCRSSPGCEVDPRGEHSFKPSTIPDPKSPNYDAQKKANEELKKRLAELGARARELMEWLLLEHENDPMWRRLSKGWNCGRARELLDDFFLDNGKGPELWPTPHPDAQGTYGSTDTPDLGSSRDPSNSRFPNGRIRLDSRLDDWELIATWMHESIHWIAAHIKDQDPNTTSPDPTVPGASEAKGREIGQQFERELRRLAGEDGMGGSTKGAVEKLYKRMKDEKEKPANPPQSPTPGSPR